MQDAQVAGLELMMRAPFILDEEPENQVTRQEAGNVAYWHFSQNICVFCEDLPGLGPVSLFGRIAQTTIRSVMLLTSRRIRWLIG